MQRQNKSLNQARLHTTDLRGTTRGIALAFALCAGALGCTRDAVRTPEGLIGSPLDQALDRFGIPTSERTLELRSDTLLLEYQNGLYPAILDTLTEGTSASVRQATWEGKPERAVWAVERGGQWVVVDALEWDADVQF